MSIVIPCYNEAKNLREGVLDQVADFVDTRAYCQEVLVVDDGSDDGSGGLLVAYAESHPKFRALLEPHRGKAGAVLAGALAAGGDYVLFCDMDQAAPIDELTKLLPHVQAGEDVVIGSRAHQRKGAPLIRRIMAAGYMSLRRLILDLGSIVDTQCGFKCFRREVIVQLATGLQVYRPGDRAATGPSVTAAFDTELLFLARKLGCGITEVPIRWRHVGTRRVHPLRESWRALQGLLLIRLNDRRGLYASFQPGHCPVAGGPRLPGSRPAS